MKINWHLSSSNPVVALTTEQIKDLKLRITRATRSNCFTMTVTRPEYNWMAGNLENCFIKLIEDEKTDGNSNVGYCLVAIGIDEFTVNQEVALI